MSVVNASGMKKDPCGVSGGAGRASSRQGLADAPAPLAAPGPAVAAGVVIARRVRDGPGRVKPPALVRARARYCGAMEPQPDPRPEDRTLTTTSSAGGSRSPSAWLLAIPHHRLVPRVDEADRPVAVFFQWIFDDLSAAAPNGGMNSLPRLLHHATSRTCTRTCRSPPTRTPSSQAGPAKSGQPRDRPEPDDLRQNRVGTIRTDFILVIPAAADPRRRWSASRDPST